MALRPAIAILVCGMAALCPLICAAEAALHACDQVGSGCGADHRHESDPPSHERHEHPGDSDPHVAHTCICTAGTSVGHAVRIPALSPSALLDAPADRHFLTLSAATLLNSAAGAAAELSRPPPDIPLLI